MLVIAALHRVASRGTESICVVSAPMSKHSTWPTSTRRTDTAIDLGRENMPELCFSNTLNPSECPTIPL